MNEDRTYSLGADMIRIFAGIGVVVIHVTDPFLIYPPFQGIGGSSWWVINVINALSRVAVPLFIILSGALLFRVISD